MFVPAKNGLFRICGYLVRRRLLRCVIICVFGKQRVSRVENSMLEVDTGTASRG